MDTKPQPPALRGFRLIGAFKLASGLLLAAAGFGIFRLIHGDVGAVVDRLVARLHLDPDNRFIHSAVARVAGLNHAHLKAIGLGTFFYSLLETIEGIGLVFRRIWGGALTVVATGLLLLPELYELAQRINAVRLTVLLVNLVILAYLVVKLRQEVRERLSSP